MLLPRYSIRTTLIATTCCAVFFLVLGQAMRERPWAIVISVAISSLLATLIVHAMLFLTTAAMTRLVGSRQQPAHTSRGGVQTTLDQTLPPPTDNSTSND